ncbi:MAG: hypothetical protein ACAI35_09420 [Candidatus Methylacidiphilales bacterium]|nr:hypothetical protein [Candidatus Methylacidiphilales bacterium]
MKELDPNLKYGSDNIPAQAFSQPLEKHKVAMYVNLSLEVIATAKKLGASLDEYIQKLYDEAQLKSGASAA